MEQLVLEEATAVLEAPTAAQESTQHSHGTKVATILATLQSGRSLNRFEAERIGDHCLHSTIAQLRGEGVNIHDEWEAVPTRFGKEVRVKRYRYMGVSQ